MWLVGGGEGWADLLCFPAPLSSAVTGELAVEMAAPTLGDPIFTGKSLRDRGSDRSPRSYGKGETEVPSEASLGAGQRQGWLGGLRGAGKPSWGLWGSDTRRGRQQTPQDGKKQRVGTPEDSLLALWGFAGVHTTWH